MQEKRKHPRVTVNGFVEVRTREGNQSYSGDIELISRGGIGFYSKSGMTAGTAVTVELICFLKSQNISYTLTGVVKNCKGATSGIGKKNEIFVVGIQFDKEINGVDHPQLDSFLKQNELMESGNHVNLKT